MIKAWIEEGKKLAKTADVEIAGQTVKVRRILNAGWWQAVLNRAEATSSAVPFSVPEDARQFLPEDGASARDIVKTACLLQALLVDEAPLADLLELSAVNGPVFVELAEKVVSAAVEKGSELEAEDVEMRKND